MSSDRAYLVRINQFSSTLSAMSSPPSVPERIEQFRWRSNAHTILKSHWTFAARQLFDIVVD